MQRCQPSRAQRPVLFLRMLQDQQRNPAFDQSDAVADAERFRFETPRTIRGGPRHIANFRDARHQLAIRFAKASTQPRRLLRTWWFTRRAPKLLRWPSRKGDSFRILMHGNRPKRSKY